MSLTEDATQFNWMLNNFVKDTSGVTDAVAVSSDGLLMAMSNTLDPGGADQVAAIFLGQAVRFPDGAEAVPYDLRLEYYNRGGGALAQLLWSSPSQTKQIIPQPALTPPGTASPARSSRRSRGSSGRC